MSATDFHVDFDSQVSEFTPEIKEAAQERLQSLAEEYRDLSGAAVTVTQSEQDKGPSRFRANVVVYVHSEEMTATQEDYNIVSALNGALAGIEQQIHEKYEKPDEPWTNDNLLGKPT